MSEEVVKVNSVDELLDWTPVKGDVEVKRLVYKSALEFRGQADDLYMAVGCLIVGRLFGWRVVRLTLSPSNYAKYQRILAFGLDEPGNFHFNEWMRAEEPLFYKSWGLKLIGKLQDFWAAVKGRRPDLPIEKRRELS